MRSFLMDMEPMERAEYYVLNKVSDGYQEAFETFNDYALSTKAQFFLGIMYLQGLGVDVDPAKAFECMENAYKGKNINAAFYLGKMYLEGIGVKKTVYKAVDFFKEAARYEDHRAELELGKLYLENKDVACDKEKAAKWMLKSAQHGNPEAQFIMGQLYKTGTGVKSDSALAVEWLERAANKGHKGAQILLGNIYRNGEGVQISRSEAEYWYAVADGKRPLRRSRADLKIFQRKKMGALGPCVHFSPTIVPSSLRSILMAAGTFGSPGMRVRVPQTGTMNPAPADSQTSLTLSFHPLGAPFLFESSVRDAWVFAMQTGSPP